MLFLFENMPIKKFLSDDAICTRKTNGEEIWEVRIGDKSIKIKDAAYLSFKKYQELKDDYIGYSQKTEKPVSKEDVEDFISEARAENFKDLGGYVVFFLKLKGEYQIRHTKFVREIK